MKQMAITLIDDAIHAGARQAKACAVLGLSARTLRRWRATDCLIDRRKGAQRAPCPHALSACEKEAILTACNSPEHQSLPPLSARRVCVIACARMNWCCTRITARP